MKILISVRHPGPAQAVIPVLKWIDREYEEVITVLSGKATEFVKSNFYEDMDERTVYLFSNGEWIKKQFDITSVSEELCEYDSTESEEFEHLVEAMAEILKEEQPDVILRTTPAIDFGTDEAITIATDRLGMSDRLRCYQECYDCGQLLDNLTYPVAVVDKIAKERMERRGIGAVVAGWMLQGVFAKYRDYDVSRSGARARMGLAENDTAYLYCMIASGDFEAEKRHFKFFLDSIGDRRFWILFHPRNTKQQKDEYLSMAANLDYQVVKEMERDEILSFSDMIISLGSAINIDAIQYQIYCRCEKMNTVSVYTYGDVTRSVFRRVFGEDSQPFSEENRGSVIVDETNYDMIFEDEHKICRKELMNQALQIFGSRDCHEGEGLIEYIKGIK